MNLRPNETLPPEPKNPAWMSERVKIRRIGKGFMVNSKPVELGEVVVVDAFSAADLVCLKKAELVS